MKKSNWMSEAGHQSGERAERLHQQAMRARSAMEVFADEFWLLAIVILIAGGVCGAVSLDNGIPQSVATEIGEPMFWIANRVAGLVVGMLGAFLIIDVPLTVAVMWLRKHRPAIFQPRR